MIIAKPEICEDSNYELRDAAAILGVSKSTIQRWTQEGSLRASVRKANHRRVWSGADLLRCWRERA